MIKMKKKLGNIFSRFTKEHQRSIFFELIIIVFISRITKETEMNKSSSRSHFICIINIKIDDNKEGNLVIIDLAGSEALMDNSKKNETTSINLSLLNLSDLLKYMSEYSKKNTTKFQSSNFRKSNITKILSTFLANNSKVTMILCCRPIVKYRSVFIYYLYDYL